ncbi:phosphoribosyltransferase-like protein [Rhizobium leguminosarum]|uniref:phosphoribosyltransferase-like protein n=1 Tax=Rhizobium leguminosarum TaxID=384 RepID=UPI003D7C3347
MLVTDFIGSGDRIVDFLNAAWRVRSVRSWWSRRNSAGLTFDVVAFSGTIEGIERVRSHSCQPSVHVSMVCPTIRSVLPPSKADEIEAFCIKYMPPRLADEALGYGRTGALIGFSHSMPNNAPAIFWKKFGRKDPLFPSRVTMGVGSPFSAATGTHAEQNRLGAVIGVESTGQPAQAITVETIVLTALRRGPRLSEAISGRLGLNLLVIEETLLKLKELQWINGRNQLTERGRLILTRLEENSAPKPLPKSRNGYYFPESLRVPRDV